MNTLSIALLFGGKSAEHEVSIRSALNIYNGLNKQRYRVLAVGIDKTGRYWLQKGEPSLAIAGNGATECFLQLRGGKPHLVNETGAKLAALDAAFPIVHGPTGEDGSLQGLFKSLQLPFVGPGVLACAVSMDKEFAKRLLNEAGLLTARSLVWRASQTRPLNYSQASKLLGPTLFIKPANMGSSVGVHKASNETEFEQAANDAFLFDDKLIVEEAIAGREIEVAVLGNERPKASLPGEIFPQTGFYDYKAKYLNGEDAKLAIPAVLTPEETQLLQSSAIKAYQALGCEGMSRIDFFLTAGGQALVNEANALPGFTDISMYAKLWEAGGLTLEALLDELVRLALSRYERENKLKASYF